MLKTIGNQSNLFENESKQAEPVRKTIMNDGRFAGVEPRIFWGIFSWLG